MASSSSFVFSIVIIVLLMGLLALLFLRRLKNDLRKCPGRDEEEDKEVASSSSSQKKYDVFLSFRGDDTRYSFVSHLHESLSNSKILTFMDDNLERGEEISQSLLDAIEASRISLVIFSENYASSKWCLNELVKILECKEHQGQIIIPVFYRVDPSDVRKQTGSYAVAFTKHEQQINLDMVKTWRDALEKAANLSGWDSNVVRPDTRLIRNIVSNVMEKLNPPNPVLPCHSIGLFGIDSRIDQILSLLHLESPDVLILGIWGAGGIGKTTVAAQLFKRIQNKFEEYYLLENAKKVLKEYSLVLSGNELLPFILKEKSLYKGTSCLDSAFLGQRFHLKKVLVILDDVDDLMSLQVLLSGKEVSFGPGSRIILTSLDKHALEVADEIYKVEKLNYADALELFNFHAFKTDLPSEFVHLSERVAKYAGGNPLALKVLGSALFGRCRDDWESALKDLSKVSSRRIHEVLRVSYNALEDEEKKIFLYVAIFFEGDDEQLVEQVLKSCFGEVKLAMSRLVEKALIAVNNERLEMHNLLRELGRKIITEESTGILCDPRVIEDILTKKKGTEAIEGISLDLTEIEELVLDFDAFMRMDRLKVLQFYLTKSEDPLGKQFYSSSDSRSKVHLPRRGLELISGELSYLRWDGYPSKHLPVKFCAEKLVSLQLGGSKLTQLWEGVQNVVNLKRIDLSFSNRLITLPDLSKAVDIEVINLEGCGSLEELPPSIQYLTKLEVLDLVDCWSLRKLPSRLDSPVLTSLNLFGGGKGQRCPKTSSEKLKYFTFSGAGIEELPQSSLNELEELFLSGCPNFTKFPQVSENIRVLILYGTGIKEIPSSIEFCTGLEQLEMQGCEELLTISTSICKLKSLEVLFVRGCSKLESFPEIQEPMPKLQFLELSACENLNRLPNSFHNLESLVYLSLKGTGIKELPSSIGLLTRLKHLEIDGCEIGTEEWQQLLCLRSLRKLNLRSCSLMEIPISFCSLMHRLKELDLSKNNFETLPPNFHQLSNLTTLKLNECRLLRSLPELPESLNDLQANDCESLETISPGGRTHQWTRLLLGNCCKLDQGARDKLVDDTITVYNNPEMPEFPSPGDYTLLPGSEIPDFFSSYRGKASSITMKVPTSINHRQLYRIAFCFVFASSSASSVLPSLKSKFVAPTPAERKKLSSCELRNNWHVKDCTYELSHLYLGDFDPRLVESDHVLMWQTRNYKWEEFMSWLSSYPGKDVSFEWSFYDSNDGKPLKHYKVKRWGVQIIHV